MSDEQLIPLKRKLEAEILKAKTDISDIEQNTIYKGSFEWRFEFPEVLNDKGEFVGFDVVIGNPPYVVNSDSIYKSYATYNSKDLYCFFFELGNKILKQNGGLAFITPSLFIKGVKYDSLRNYLLDVFDVLKIEDKGDGVFDGVSMPTAITFTIKNTKNKSQKWEDLFSLNSIVNKMKDKSSKVQELVSIQRGLEIGKDKTKEIKGIKILTGEDVSRYYYSINKYVSEDVFKEFDKGNKEYYTKPRILIRETGSRMTCFFIDEEVVCNRSLYVLLPHKINIKYLLGILNSRLLQYFYEINFKADTEVFPKIRIAQVKELPIKQISPEAQRPFIEKVNQILTLKQSDSQADTSVLEAEIDAMVYDLYELTAAEILIVEGK